MGEQIYNFYKENIIDILRKTNEINKNLNDKLSFKLVFIDISRAFDTLYHQKLIEKLESTEIEAVLCWCKKTLDDIS